MNEQPTLQPIGSSRSLVDQVHAAILDGICEGRLEPGRPLRQEWLAESLGVSRQPVLQALLLLKRQGFICDAGRRGVMVAPVDPRFVTQLYDVRGALDGRAAYHAALGDRALARAQGAKLIAAGRAAIRARDVRKLIVADMAFHHFVYELSGNPLIAEAATLHWQHIKRVMALFVRAEPSIGQIWDEHAAILAAIVEGRPDEAEAQARRHAENNARLVAARFEGDAAAEAPTAA